MNTKLQSCLKMLLAGLLVLSLSACLDDGDDGINGADGADGADGAAGLDGDDGMDALPLAENIVALNPVLDLSQTVSYDAFTQELSIHFFLTDGNGNGVDVFDDAYELRIYVAELIPDLELDAAFQTGVAEAGAWDRLIYERGTPGNPDDRQLPGVLTLLDAETGEYNYVLSDTLEASDRVTRVTVRARWRETIDGTRYVYANPVNASYDFLLSDPEFELLSSGADMVLTENCEKCHSVRIGDVGHGGGYTAVKTCNNCHNVNYMESRNGGEGDLAFMVHRIHNSGKFDVIDDGIDFAELTFPQPTSNCEVCHGGAPQADLHWKVPTIKNCTSCHEDTTFTALGTHSGGESSDGLCTNCHKPGGVPAFPETTEDIVVAHSAANLAADNDVSEYEVTIELLDPDTDEPYPFVAGVTPPLVDHVFENGDQPIVRVTLAGANPVTYTAAPDAEGDTDGNLSTADLYVYGPRADAVPVLTVNSTTDGGKQQGHDLFVGSDLQVRTDASGYKYELMDDIDQLVAGTYMVRFEGLDYDTPGDGFDPEYVTASSGLINFQVKTADVEPKVAGDACAESCHGDTIMHLTGAHPHHAPFNTDHCLGCHDVSANYADYIGNRVHAVHRASITGDLHVVGDAPNLVPRDWSEITFPQDANNCTICHTNPDPDAPVWRTPDAIACGGCHGGFLGKATKFPSPFTDPADYADAVPESFPDADQERVMRELAAAAHMDAMGGDFNPAANPQTQCIVCHGEGRIADLYVTHRLVTFPPLVEEDPDL